MNSIEDALPTEPGPWSIELHSNEGGSDKVYNIALQPEADLSGFIVSYQNGRRGGTLACGIKTKAPVGYDEARKIVAKLLKEKLAKGYKATGSSVDILPAVDAVDTGLRPMLLNSVDREEAKSIIEEGGIAVQEKIDGERRMIRIRAGEATGVNRKGFAVALSAPIADAAKAFPDCVLDGEQVGDVLHVFDILSLGTQDLTGFPFRDRLAALSAMMAVLKNDAIRLTETAMTVTSGLALMAEVDSFAGEGVVLRNMAARYVPGRPATGGPALKCKFVKTATCIVTAQNEQRSVALAVLDGDRQVPVGNVTIPANHAVPAPGSLVEVRYLYAYRGGSLFQPVYLGERSDLDLQDAKLAQLSYRPEPIAA